MNSFRYRNSLSTKAAIAALLVVSISTPVFSQDGAEVPPLTLPGVDGQQPAAKLPPVKLPEGATIQGSREKVRTMATEAGRSLDDLIGGSVSDRSEAEVGAMSDRQRNIMSLKMQLEEAKLAKELWVELNGEADEESDEVEKLNADKARLEAELVVARARPAAAVVDPDPVVAEITGVGDRMTAKILVPYMGMVHAERGTTLPNGMKVVGVSKSGVTVQSAGGSKALAFGTSVPRQRPISAGGMPSAGGSDIMNQIAR